MTDHSRNNSRSHTLPMTARKKSGKQYRYYVINRKFNIGAGVCNVPNQPAELPEQAVVGQVLSFMRKGVMVSEYWAQIQELNPTIDEPQAVVTLLQRTAEIWGHLLPAHPTIDHPQPHRAREH